MADDNAPKKAYIKWYTTNPICGIAFEESKKAHGDTEYILKSVSDKKLQDATKHIREVYKKYKYTAIEEIRNSYEAIIINEFWQAIKATVESKDEEKGSA